MIGLISYKILSVTMVYRRVLSTEMERRAFVIKKFFTAGAAVVSTITRFFSMTFLFYVMHVKRT